MNLFIFCSIGENNFIYPLLQEDPDPDLAGQKTTEPTGSGSSSLYVCKMTLHIFVIASNKKHVCSGYLSFAELLYGIVNSTKYSEWPLEVNIYGSLSDQEVFFKP